jgi:hypothetical protein
MKPNNISPEQIQEYIYKGAIIHPEVYLNFLRLLHVNSLKGQLCMTPQARLEFYSLSVDKKIADRVNFLLSSSQKPHTTSVRKVKAMSSC